MKLLFFCPRWGSDSIPWPQFLKNVKDAGFDGVEIGLPQSEAEQQELLDLIKSYNLLYIIQHYETNTADFEEHYNQYENYINCMAGYKPYLVNSHTGRDFFSQEQNISLINSAQKIATEHGVPIAHETHRSRFNFAAHITKNYLHLKSLKLTWDVSHWICVAETLLYDQQETIDQVIPHVQHLHARIGHTQGPQINDPLLPQWKETIERHLQLWDQVINYHRANNSSEFGITTEFGPPPYMPVVPQDKTAVAYQFELNTYILQLLKKRYSS